MLVEGALTPCYLCSGTSPLQQARWVHLPYLSCCTCLTIPYLSLLPLLAELSSSTLKGSIKIHISHLEKKLAALLCCTVMVNLMPAIQC